MFDLGFDLAVVFDLSAVLNVQASNQDTYPPKRQWIIHTLQPSVAYADTEAIGKHLHTTQLSLHVCSLRSQR